MKKKCYLILAVLFLLITVKAYSQNSLEVLDPQQTWNRVRGTIEEATFSVSPQGLFSQVSMYLTFSARGASFYYNNPLEVVLKFELPQGSYVTDLWLWIGDKVSKGILLDVWKASSIYESIVNRRQDPAILMKKGERSYELRVYPMDKMGTRKVRVTYLTPNNWNTSSLSIPLPLNLLSTSLNKVTNSNVVTWKNWEWQNPRIANYAQTFTDKYDTFFDNHLIVKAPDYQTNSSVSLDFDNPMINGVYFRYFKKDNEGFYQLSLFPGTSISQSSKKVLFLIDYDSRKSNTTRKEIIEQTKSILLQKFNKKDNFNLFYSGLNIGKLSTSWITADTNNITTKFYGFTEGAISLYSNLPQLLKEGYEFISNNNGGVVYLISNSDLVGNYQTANQLISDLNKIMKIPTPTYILDYNDKEYYYYYFNNRSYLGNEYFYDNLARTTGGAFIRSSNISNAFAELLSKSDNIINSYDLYTSLQTGFCYSRQTLQSSNESVSPSKAITQVGKFVGEFPFIIKSSGVFDSQPFTETRIIQDQNFLKGEEQIKKMWASNKISALEKGTQSNSIINEIIEISRANRVLSKYTAFLSLEDDSSFCKDCYRDDGKPTGVEDDETEIPTEFSVQAYPNPFNSQVQITVNVPNNLIGKSMSFKIYNLLGQVVKTFEINSTDKNIVKIFWDGKNDSGEVVASGIYIFTAVSGNFVKSMKLMYMK